MAGYFLAGAPRFWVNWLLWFVFMVCLSLGALFLVALQHMTGRPVERSLAAHRERIAALTPWLVPVAAIALFSLPVVFSWMQPNAAATTPLVLKEHWLNRPFFIIRLAVCLALWVVSYGVLVRGSVRQDARRTRAHRQAAALLAGVHDPPGVDLTSFAFDWVSSLEAAWYSDIFGVYLFAGAVTTAIAAVLLAVIYLERRGRLPGVTRDHVYNLGGLLFGFTIFWAYIAFSQYLLQWYADLPEEVFWFQQRTRRTHGARVRRTGHRPLLRAFPGADLQGRQEELAASQVGGRVGHLHGIRRRVLADVADLGQGDPFRLARAVLRRLLRLGRAPRARARHEHGGGHAGG